LYAVESRFDHQWLLSVSGFCAMVTTTAGNSRFNAIDGWNPQLNFFLREGSRPVSSDIIPSSGLPLEKTGRLRKGNGIKP